MIIIEDSSFSSSMETVGFFTEYQMVQNPDTKQFPPPFFSRSVTERSSLDGVEIAAGMIVGYDDRGRPLPYRNRETLHGG